MSTQINVTVDSGGLRRRAQQQTQANRQAKLEGDASRRIERQGQRARDITQGPDGRPLYGVPPAQVARREEPAAWRTVKPFELNLTPVSEVPPGVFQTQLKNATVKPVNFIDWITFEPRPDPRSYFFNSADGPLGGTYIRCRKDGINNPGTGLRAITQDLIFDSEDPTAKRKDFTIDFWVYIDVPSDPSSLYDNLFYCFELSTAADPYPGGSIYALRIEVQYTRNQFDLGPLVDASIKRGKVISGNQSYGPIITYRDYDPSGAVTGSYLSEINGVPTGGDTPSLLKNSWNHIASVRKGGLLSFFINGKLIASRLEYESPTQYLSPITDSACLHVGQIFANGDNPAVDNRIANLRVITKALFTTNFDPYSMP